MVVNEKKMRALTVFTYLGLAAAFAVLSWYLDGRVAGDGFEPRVVAGNWADSLPVARWVEIRPHGTQFPAYRWTHSGAVYDSQRDSLLMFGADSHRLSFDNSVYELRLGDLHWRRHQAPSPAYALRTNREGYRLAGIAQRQPWPMHAYDSLVYDPKADALRVFSGAKHSFVPAPGLQLDPAWSYSLAARSWHQDPVDTDGLPNFFATGVAFDPARDTIIGYASLTNSPAFLGLATEDEIPRRGVWELGPGRDEWRLVAGDVHHWGWINAEFDTRHSVLLIFGGDPNSSDVLAYQPNTVPGVAGQWARRSPAGDRCPGGYYFPAAYDSKRGKTLVVLPDGKSNSITCVYDYGSNTWQRLPDTQLPSLGLNYTMIYSSAQDLFVLVGGSFFNRIPTRVWALKLDDQVAETP